MVFANVSLFFVRFFIKEKKGREVKIVFLIVIRLKVFTAEKGALFVIFLQLLKKKKIGKCEFAIFLLLQQQSSCAVALFSPVNFYFNNVTIHSRP